MDLINSTARQIWLQKLLKFPTPEYLHMPVAIHANGEKLSKQTSAPAINKEKPASYWLHHALMFLNQDPPGDLAGYNTADILDWAIMHWNCSALKGLKNKTHDKDLSSE